MDYTEVEVPNQIVALTKIMSSIVGHYIKRNQLLIELLYEKGVTQVEIGKKLGVGRAAISLQYPKGGKKNV